MENIFDASRYLIENSQPEMSRYTPDLMALVNKLVEQFRDDMARLDILCSIDIGEHCKIYFDINRLRVPLSNLIDNAIRFYDPLKAEHHISIYGTVSFSACSISIADNGIGIKKEHHSKIFDMFFTGSDVAGQGLGLFVSKEIIEDMGGGIIAESNNDKGARFTIWLPNRYVQMSS